MEGVRGGGTVRGVEEWCYKARLLSLSLPTLKAETDANKAAVRSLNILEIGSESVAVASNKNKQEIIKES